MDDYGLDIDEVTRVIDAAEVLVVRFAIVDKRLLIDSRTSENEGPLIAIVPRAGSVEERFKSSEEAAPPLPAAGQDHVVHVARHIDTPA
jgi:hypothetical protein